MTTYTSDVWRQGARTTTSTRRGRLALVGAALLAGALGAGCASDGPDVGESEQELTAAQCTYFAVNNRVTVCHRTPFNHPRFRYIAMRGTVTACRLHARFDPDDYIAYNDPSCNGQGCYPEGAPYDGTVECCPGLSGASGTCQPAPPACADLDDGDACTTDTCEDGVTVHTPVVIGDGSACTTDACDPVTGAVTHVAVPVDDGDACTADACDAASGAIVHAPAAVDDGDACTVDACDPATGDVTHLPVMVDDGNDCTIDSCDPTTGEVRHVVDPGSAACACALDLCPLDPDKTAPGACGCGLPDDATCGGFCFATGDADLDGTLDCFDDCPAAPDTDSDGDGAADCIDGCPANPSVTNAHDVESCGPACTLDSPDEWHRDADGVPASGPDCIPDCMQGCLVGCQTET